MVIGFLTAVAGGITSEVIIDSVIAGAGLAMSIYSCSKGMKQSQRRGSGTRRTGRR